MLQQRSSLTGLNSTPLVAGEGAESGDVGVVGVVTVDVAEADEDEAAAAFVAACTESDR